MEISDNPKVQGHGEYKKMNHLGTVLSAMTPSP